MAPCLRPGRGSPLRRLALLIFALLGATSVAGELVWAQKHKVPGLDKVMSGSSHQAFSGKVKSLDLEQKLLSVSTVQGSNTEVFPVKKGVVVLSAQGEKLKIKALTPGTNVIVFYDQRSDRRKVNQIMVLEPGTAEGKKVPPRS